jgi:mRNA-degrading endonuclease toxin of MazEF toxin-antitoxin module
MQPYNAKEGNLIFIQENEKRRPYICVKVFYNKAGVPYNWLVLPITSNNSLGSENLIPITHPKLSKNSYVKINNIKTIPWNDDYEVKNKIDNETLDKIIKRIINTLEDVEGKIERSIG